MKLSTSLPFSLMITKWAAILNPLLDSPLNSASIISDVKLSIGSNTINHLLGKKQTGWFLVDQQASASIYRSMPFNTTTLTLTSDAVVTVSIGVF